MNRQSVSLAVSFVCMIVAAPVAAYEEAPVSDGGTLTGVVRFVGSPPGLPPLHVNKNRDLCGESKPSEALVLGADRGVRGSVIMLEGVTRGKKAPAEVVIDNHRCVFVPHVAATMVGAQARVKNSDPILHNTHGFMGKPTVFNLALPNKEQVVDITRRLTKSGVIRILCDAHPHMSGWLIVHSSPYVVTTAERGRFEMSGIPPGTYRVTMWHEGFRQKGTDKDGRPVYDDPVTVSKDVTIGAKAAATVEFELR